MFRINGCVSGNWYSCLTNLEDRSRQAETRIVPVAGDVRRQDLRSRVNLCRERENLELAKSHLPLRFYCILVARRRVIIPSYTMARDYSYNRAILRKSEPAFKWARTAADLLVALRLTPLAEINWRRSPKSSARGERRGDRQTLRVVAEGWKTVRPTFVIHAVDEKTRGKKYSSNIFAHPGTLTLSRRPCGGVISVWATPLRIPSSLSTQLIIQKLPLAR